MSTHFPQVLAEFGQRMGLPDLVVDAIGHCALQLDAVQLHMLWLQEERNVLCYCPLGSIHPETHGQFVWQLLAANNFYLGTRGATLSWDDTSHQCHLSLLMDSEHLSVNAFEDSVQQLVNTAEHWSQRISQSAQASSGELADPTTVAPVFPTGFFGQMA